MTQNEKFGEKLTVYRNENWLLSYEKYRKFDINNPFIHEC